jgi:hypothetical protein
MPYHVFFLLISNTLGFFFRWFRVGGKYWGGGTSVASASLDRGGVGHWGMVVLELGPICLQFTGVLGGVGGVICL